MRGKRDRAKKRRREAELRAHCYASDDRTHHPRQTYFHWEELPALDNIPDGMLIRRDHCIHCYREIELRAGPSRTWRLFQYVIIEEEF